MAKSSRKKGSFINKPYYEEGPEAFRKFVYKNLKYPKEALKEKKEGVVMLRYHINQKGAVTGSDILHSVGYGCDEEAQRIVKLLKFKIQKNPRKLRIKFSKTIKIKFKLPKEKKQVVSYTTTNTVSKKKASNSYNYTISF